MASAPMTLYETEIDQVQVHTGDLGKTKSVGAAMASAKAMASTKKAPAKKKPAAAMATAAAAAPADAVPAASALAASSGSSKIGAETLGNGWTVETFKRGGSGPSAGTTYKIFKNPFGKAFRTKKDADANGFGVP